MFGSIVMGIDRQKFERALEETKERKGVHLDTDLTAADLKGIVDEFKVIYKRSTGESFPSDPYEQLKRL